MIKPSKKTAKGYFLASVRKTTLWVCWHLCRIAGF